MNRYEEYRKNAYESALQDSEERKRQEQQQAEALKKETVETTITPTPEKKSFQHKKPNEIFGKNVIEARNAVAGGVVDFYNSIASLPKFLDKNFYKPTDPTNPWKYDAPWLIKRQTYH